MAIQRYRGVGMHPWSLFKELEEIRDSFADFFRPGSRQLISAGTWAPAIEVYQDDDKYIVKADLPGLKKEDIDLSVTKNVLTIKGERKYEQERKENDFYYCERSYGNFIRSISLPGNVDVGGINASYKDGVLNIELPKAETEKEKKIDIAVE